MNELFQEILQHPKVIIEILFAYWAFSAMVSSMPKPKADDSQFWYGWLFTFLHTFAGSIQQAAKNPAVPQAVQKALGIQQQTTQEK